MKKPIVMAFMAIAVNALSVGPARGEDIDLFVGGTGGGGAANVLIVLDNTAAAWNQPLQHWAGGVAQGQGALQAIKNVIGRLDDSVNVGFATLVDNAGTNGLVIRYAMRPMTAANRTALQNKVQAMYTAFSTSGTTTAPNYSQALLNGWKYFGGYTSPAHATDDVAGSPTGATAFGATVYAGPPVGFSGADTAAYTGSSFAAYAPPAAAANACGGKNYVVLIGNSFPSGDTTSTVLTGVGGNATQLAMPVLATNSSTANATIGLSSACYASTSAGQTACATAACPVSADSCTCGSPISVSSCSAGQTHWTVYTSLTATTATPTGTFSVPTGASIRYADEWARFMYQADANSATGQQNVTVYTIDVFQSKQNANQSALLYNMATAGGGKYAAAKSQTQIEAALSSAMAEIQGANSTFASASLPISATNRTVNNNEVYIGMFRPDQSASPLWFGNLKRYKIASFNGDLKLADTANIDAVNPLTGFVTDCATSWYTSDSGSFWSGLAISPSPAGLCGAPNTTFGAWSDAPDGPKVEKGAVAEVLRKGNTPLSSASWSLYRSVYTKGVVDFTAANSGMATADVDFVRGLSIDSNGYNQTYAFTDADGTSQSTSVRPTIHGDVVHSRPLAVSYGGSTGTVVFYGSNDGSYRAVSAANGQELWSYIAPEHYPTLPRLRANSPLISYPSISSFGITPTPTAKPYMWDGSTGLYQPADNSAIWIFPTMRRGGRMIYAFDVTTPSSPTLKWKVGCPNLGNDTGCTTGMGGIGQTWSTPAVAVLDGVGPVLAVGGGYDACEDGAAAATCASAKGNAVYFLNAATGALVTSFTTTGRVVADVVFADTDGDGNPDYAFAADTRGNLYRIALGSDTAHWAMTRVAYTTGSGRKFLHAPAVVPVTDKVTNTPYVYLALGSGDREQPLESQYPFTTPITNRFYVFLDGLTSATPVNLDDTAALANNTVATSCASPASLPGASKGWSMDLVAGAGEQVVTSAVVVNGTVMFSTNRAIPKAANVCAPRGEARGYALNLFNASGAISAPVAGTACGGDRSAVFVGGGLPPSPVVANVKLDDGRVASVVIGAANLNGASGSSPIQAQSAVTLPPQRRYRVYWRREGID